MSSKFLPRPHWGAKFNGWYVGSTLETCNASYYIMLRPKNAKWKDFDCRRESWGEYGKNHSYTVGLVPRRGYAVEQRYAFRRWSP